MKKRKSFPLRIDATVYAALEEWAQQELRSVNGQIEYILKLAVNKRRGLETDATNPPLAESSDNVPSDSPATGDD
jgi:hypothetical protein